MVGLLCSPRLFLLQVSEGTWELLCIWTGVLQGHPCWGNVPFFLKKQTKLDYFLCEPIQSLLWCCLWFREPMSQLGKCGQAGLCSRRLSSAGVRLSPPWGQTQALAQVCFWARPASPSAAAAAVTEQGAAKHGARLNGWSRRGAAKEWRW